LSSGPRPTRRPRLGDRPRPLAHLATVRLPCSKVPEHTTCCPGWEVRPRPAHDSFARE
jgi:hypothetical protein